MSIAIAKRAKRQRRTPEEARRLILETAQALIASTGPEGLRLQDIAAAAGISHPLILHHFGSREGLVRALTRQAAAELRDKLVAAMASSEYSIEQQLDRVFDAFRDGMAQRLAWLVTVDPGGGAGYGNRPRGHRCADPPGRDCRVRRSAVRRATAPQRRSARDERNGSQLPPVARGADPRAFAERLTCRLAFAGSGAGHRPSSVALPAAAGLS